MAYALETARSKAYSGDMRWRMVYQRCIQGFSYTNIASNLNVDPSTVHRTVKLFEETGTICSIQGYRETSNKVLTIHDELAILMFRAQQRSDELRKQFQEQVSIYDPSMLVFVDECGSDKRSALRRYGYALRGKRAVTEKLLVRGKRFSAIGILCIDGIVDVYTTDGSVDGEKFCTFVERNLLPQLLPFNGINPRSVVIIDNAPIHHVDDAVQMIEEAGAFAIFLPPYSPHLNPIEEAFSKMKYFLKANDPFVQVCSDYELEDNITAGFATITAEDCFGWMQHSGYIV